MDESLTAAELAIFGVSSAEETLPVPPPKEGLSVGTGGSNGSKRTIEAASLTVPVGRAKRPKNVKFSPAKVGGKALARRSMTTSGPKTNTEGEVSLPNNDFCDACGGKGHFLCCDGGCLRSFHFNCLEPPMELDDLTDDSWYCKVCRAAEAPPPKLDVLYFRELIYRVDTENPKAFVLTPDVKSFYKNVTTGATGDFIDIQEHRPPSKITGRAVGQEDRDGYRLRDKSGKTMLCYKCNQSASLTKLRRIISCDFCEQHWHLDCLDPPMTGMPPPTRKWMCPVHSDHVLPKSRQLKSVQTVVVAEPGEYNNGDVVIIPRREPPRPEPFEEVTVNRVRYQVPEETLIMDFWGRLQDPAHLEQAKKSRMRVVREGSAIDVDSESDTLSDADPPHLANSPRKIYASNSSALDDLATLADTFFSQLTTKASLEATSYSTQDKGKGRAVPSNKLPATPRAWMRRSPSPGGAVDFSVATKDDYAALVHVRKMLLGLNGEGSKLAPAVKSAYIGFLDGDALIPKLSYLNQNDSNNVKSSEPWNLPWDEARKETPVIEQVIEDIEMDTEDTENVLLRRGSSATTIVVPRTFSVSTPKPPLPPSLVNPAVVTPKTSNGIQRASKFTPNSSYTLSQTSTIPGLASPTTTSTNTFPTKSSSILPSITPPPVSIPVPTVTLNPNPIIPQPKSPLIPGSSSLIPGLSSSSSSTITSPQLVIPSTIVTSSTPTTTPPVNGNGNGSSVSITGTGLGLTPGVVAERLAAENKANESIAKAREIVLQTDRAGSK